MKKILIAAFCLNGVLAFAQFTLKKVDDGTTINNGDVFTFHSLEEPDNSLGFKITNTSSAPINLKAQVVSILNLDPSFNGAFNNALCFGPLCNNNVVAGNSYSATPLTLAPGASNGNFDYLENYNPGLNSDLPVEYVIKIYQLNASGGDSGISVTVTYRYQATLATRNFNALANAGIQMQSNIVGNQLDVTTLKNVHVGIYDMTGKLVRSSNLLSGEQHIDVSSLNSGVYIANFRNESNQQTSAKFVKK